MTLLLRGGLCVFLRVQCNETATSVDSGFFVFAFSEKSTSRWGTGMPVRLCRNRSHAVRYR